MAKSISKCTKIILAVGVPIAAIIIAVAVMLIVGIYNGNKPKQITYFYDNACGSCDYEGEFINLFNDEVGDIKGQANFSLEMHNVFSRGDEAFIKMCEKLEISKEERSTPMLIIGDRYIKSENAIKADMREVFCNEFEIKDDSTLTYYFRPTCKDCERIKGFIDETFAKHTDLRVRRIDTTEQEPKDKFKALLTELKIPNEKWEVPFIYYKGKFLSGDKEIEEKLEEFIVANK